MGVMQLPMTKRQSMRFLSVVNLLIASTVAISPAVGQSDREPAPKSDDYFGLLHGTKHGGVVYHDAVGELKCDIYVPEGMGPFPTILAIHGGAWRSGSKVHLVRHAFRFCNAGFVVVSINYRHAPDFPFPAQIQDAFSALRFMRNNAERYRMDLDKLFGYGYSAGGHLIALLATSAETDWSSPDDSAALRQSPAFLGVAAGGAPYDFEWLADQSRALVYWMGATKGDQPEQYRAASPALRVTERSPPFFLFHGETDRLVPRACTDRMAAALQAHRVPCDVLILENHGHLAAFTDDEAIDAVIQFYRSTLEKSANVPFGVRVATEK
jgi:acetyl esterase/lipase